MDYFLKIGEIQGESQAAGHAGEIDTVSWSWSETHAESSAGTGGSGAGKVQMEDFRFVIFAIKASPKLFLACARGERIAKAILTCRKAALR
jgi:type VI secretion system secreted protein Hcp